MDGVGTRDARRDGEQPVVAQNQVFGMAKVAL